MKTVHEVSRLSGVSIRTLHYYDEISLLCPDEKTEAGYRLYSDENLKTLQQILLFRSLQFPLKEIRDMMADPDFCREEALQQQLDLLNLQKQQLEQRIQLTESLLKGENTMDFTAFDETKIEAYKKEAKEKWGHTGAYRAYEQKNDKQDHSRDMMEIFSQIGQLKHLPPEDAQVQKKIQALQQFISDHYYPCTKEMLLNLGQMYVADERFMQNIDAAGGEDTANFTQKAIAIYCK